MPKTPTKNEAIVLPATIDLNFVSDLKSILQSNIEANETKTIDASQVTRVTTPAVQILLAYAKTITAEGGKPLILNPTDALKAAFGDLGLTDQLTQWSVS